MGEEEREGEGRVTCAMQQYEDSVIGCSNRRSIGSNRGISRTLFASLLVSGICRLDVVEVAVESDPIISTNRVCVCEWCHS